jgi:tetratricopeptide (TPR) repeat protein
VPRRNLILAALLIAVIGAGVWAGRFIWQRRVQTALAAAGVAPIPDLSRWPAELKQQIAQESAAVPGASSPAEPLARLATLYWANGYGTEAERALGVLRQLDPTNARWSYLQADLRWRAGDQAGAELALQATIALDAHYAPAWLRLGEIRTKRGATDLARECYTKAATVGPGIARNDYSLIHFDATHGGDRDANIRRLQELARVHSGIREIHELLAGMLADRDATEAARERKRASESELSLGTEDPWVDTLYELCFDSNRLMLRAVALQREGRLKEAEQLLVKVVRLAPTQPANPLGWQLLSDLYLKAGRQAEARATLEQAVKQFPDEPEMSLLLARLLCTMQQPEAAVANMQQAVQRWTERGELHAALGVALHSAGNYAAAVAALRTALRLDPTLTEAQYQLGLSLLELGQRDEAKAAMTKALAMRPEYPEALFALAALELDAGDYVAAEPIVFKVYALDPEEPNAQRLLASWHLLKGMAAAQAGDGAEADRQYQAGLAVAPEFALLLRETGKLAERSGHWPEAVEAFKHYVRVKPDDPQGYLSLSLALRQIDRPTEATTALQRGLSAAQQAGDKELVTEFNRLLGR